MFNPNNPFRKNAVSDAASGVLKNSIEEKAKYAEMTNSQLLEDNSRYALDEIDDRKRNGKWTIQESSQLAELSKKTLGSYINKAATDRHNKGYRSAEAMQKGDYKAAGKEIGDSIVKRQKGIERAVKKLTKEDEQIDEVSVDLARRAYKKQMSVTDKASKAQVRNSLRGNEKLAKKYGAEVEKGKNREDKFRSYGINKITNQMKKDKESVKEGAIKRDGAMDTYKKKPEDYKPSKMGAGYDSSRDKSKNGVDLNREDKVEINGKNKSKPTKEKVSESVIDRALGEYRGRMKVLHEMRMSDDARELQLYIENDGQLYRQQTTSIMKNLQKKFEKGQYDSNLARKLWRYLVDNGAKKYVQEHGSRGDKAANMFPGKVRDEVAAAMEADWKSELEAGNKI